MKKSTSATALHQQQPPQQPTAPAQQSASPAVAKKSPVVQKPQPTANSSSTPVRQKTKVLMRRQSTKSPLKRKAPAQTPAEDKLKRIEKDIVTRTALHDLMYRQSQLEDAVKEARKVNIIIEEERERMRALKNRLKEVNLSQYVKEVKQQIKEDGKPNIDEADYDDLPTPPGLIPPKRKPGSKQQPTKEKDAKQQKKPQKEEEEPPNYFDDNYAFYMYYLNTAGHLVTPVEQLFRHDEKKREELKKFQHEQEKKSRVVKPKFLGTNPSKSPQPHSPPKKKPSVAQNQDSKELMDQSTIKKPSNATNRGGSNQKAKQQEETRVVQGKHTQRTDRSVKQAPKHQMSSSSSKNLLAQHSTTPKSSSLKVSKQSSQSNPSQNQQTPKKGTASQRKSIVQVSKVQSKSQRGKAPQASYDRQEEDPEEEQQQEEQEQSEEEEKVIIDEPAANTKSKKPPQPRVSIAQRKSVVQKQQVEESNKSKQVVSRNQAHQIKQSVSSHQSSYEQPKVVINQFGFVSKLKQPTPIMSNRSKQPSDHLPIVSVNSPTNSQMAGSISSYARRPSVSAAPVSEHHFSSKPGMKPRLSINQESPGANRLKPASLDGGIPKLADNKAKQRQIQSKTKSLESDIVINDQNSSFHDNKQTLGRIRSNSNNLRQNSSQLPHQSSFEESMVSQNELMQSPQPQKGKSPSTFLRQSQNQLQPRNSKLDHTGVKQNNKKKGVTFDEMLNNARRKSESVVVPSVQQQSNQRYKSEIEAENVTMKGTKLVKKTSKSVEETQPDSESALGLRLPPIPKPFAVQTISKPQQNTQSRPPLPQIKSSSSAQTLNTSQISSKDPIQVPLPSVQPQTLANISQTNQSFQESSRNSQQGDSERKSQAQRGIDYYNQQIKDARKPKADPKLQIDIELRKNSVSLSSLELSMRQKPIKKVQLADLLDD